MRWRSGTAGAHSQTAAGSRGGRQPQQVQAYRVTDTRVRSRLQLQSDSEAQVKEMACWRVSPAAPRRRAASGSRSVCRASLAGWQLQQEEQGAAMHGGACRCRCSVPSSATFLPAPPNALPTAPHLLQRVQAAGAPARLHSAQSAAQGGSTRRQWHLAHEPAREGGQGGPGACQAGMPWPAGKAAGCHLCSNPPRSKQAKQAAGASAPLACPHARPAPPSCPHGVPRRRGRPLSCC